MSNLLNSFWFVSSEEWNDISTASYDSKTYTGVQNTNLRGSFFRDDGIKLYTIGLATDTVYQHTLSVAWDVSTASYDTKLKSVSAESSVPQSVWFSPDGVNMYVNKTAAPSAAFVFQYTLSTAWDVSTASYTGNSYLTNLASFNDFSFSPDGTKLILLRSSNAATDRLFVHSLSVAWDITTVNGTADSEYDFSSAAGTVNGFFFKPDGDRFYLLDATSNLIRQFSLSTIFDLTTTTDDLDTFDYSTQTTTAFGIFIGNNGTKIYLSSFTVNTIHQYSL